MAEVEEYAQHVFVEPWSRVSGIEILSGMLSAVGKDAERNEYSGTRLDKVGKKMWQGDMDSWTGTASLSFAFGKGTAKTWVVTNAKKNRERRCLFMFFVFDGWIGNA